MQKMSRDRLVGVQARGALRGFAALGAELLAEVSDSCHASQPARPPARQRLIVNLGPPIGSAPAAAAAVCDDCALPHNVSVPPVRYAHR
jgi:hypothetical protein